MVALASNIVSLQKRQQREYLQALASGNAPTQDRPKFEPPLDEIVKIVEKVAAKSGRKAVENTLKSLSQNNAALAGLLKQELEEKEEENADPRFIKKEDKRLLKLSPIEEIYETPDAEYLISKVLEVATVSMLFGLSGTGKTFTSLHIGLSIAHGLFWHGYKTKSGPVWYVNTEGKRGLKKRLKAWYVEHSDLKPSPNFYTIPWALDLKEYAQELEDTLADAEVKPVLIVLDNFSMCVSGISQNLQEEVTPVLRELHDIAERYGSHIMIVHHTNKSGEFNGSMAFKNHVDVMIELKKQDASDKESPIIFSSFKTRDDEEFPDIRTQLKQVNIYYDEENQDFVTSCVTVSCDTQEPEKATPDALIRAMEILKANGQLNCGQWSKYCNEVYKFSRASFYRVRAQLEGLGYIKPVESKTNGKAVFYTLSEVGLATIQKPVSNQSQPNEIGVKPVSTSQIPLMQEDNNVSPETSKMILKKAVSPVSNQYQETGYTGQKPVSPVSTPYRVDTGETGFDTALENETIEEPDYLNESFNLELEEEGA